MGLKINFMKKIFVLLLIAISYCGFSCDMCGCYMGITPYDNQSGFSLVHRYRSFNGYEAKNQSHFVFPTYAYRNSNTSTLAPIASNTASSPLYKHGDGHGTSLTEPNYDPSDFEIYKTVELRAKYFLHQRWEINFILPYSINTTLLDGSFSKVKGLGDIHFMSGYHIIRKIEVEGMQHRLIGGMGVKLPTGKSNQLDEQNNRYNFMQQTGTGSTDGFIYLNYIAGLKNLGLNLLGMYKINSNNRFNERIGNSTTAYLNLFYRIKWKNWYFIPSLQNNYEYTKGLYLNNELEPNTNMSNVMSGLGLDVYYKNLGINASYQLCVLDQTAETNLHSAGRMVLGLTYNFNQTKYLIK